MKQIRKSKEIKDSIFKGLDEAISITKNLDKKKNLNKKEFAASEVIEDAGNNISKETKGKSFEEFNKYTSERSEKSGMVKDKSNYYIKTLNQKSKK